ncbi:MAG TPA: hypothetical protein VGH90_13855 [Chthoniobacteraceae bacterium]|jgi:uncharacterized membrane protein
MLFTRKRRKAKHLERLWNDALPAVFREDALLARDHLRDGRFQRGLSLMAGASSVLAGLEVSYEHYRGSYGQKIMWTPVALSGALAGAGILGCFSRLAARTVLRWVSVLTILDCLTGFIFHIRGIARKPGGWKMPVANIIMGPPIFAPLLFGVSAYLGLIASYLRPEEAPALDFSVDRVEALVALLLGQKPNAWRSELRVGRFQKHLAFATLLSAFFSGFEALYSHYKNNFKFAAQWTPIAIAPALMVAAGATIRNPKVGRAWLPIVSGLAITDGAVGFLYHVRGVLRRPGGLKKPFYNVMYGPPIFAPLLFAACGVLGVLTCLLRRERR